MSIEFLDFELPIAELQEKISALESISKTDDINVEHELSSLKEKNEQLTEKIFSSLSDWQISQLARHPNRPQALHYIQHIFDDFIELHGDRHYGDDMAIVTGIGKLDGLSVIVIGQQKGDITQNKIKHNFGMPKPEGYRKALRLMKMAEKFSLPIVTLVDTPGAYPGIGAEERNQSEAIARNLYEMAGLKTPSVGVVVGEGGSGGALAISVVDTMIMLEYSIYSVISPEGCASILYKDAKKAEIAAKALKLTSKSLKEAGLIDVIVDEPLGGAHRDPMTTTQRLKQALIDELTTLRALSEEELLEKRQQKILNFGDFKN